MERVSLAKVGGACAILYIIALIVAFIALAAADLLEAEDAAEILPIMAEHQNAVAIGGWLFVLAPILLAVAGLSFFYALRQAGSLMWVALLAFSGGALLIVDRAFIWLAMNHKLAPAYADAAEGTGGTLIVVGDTLLSIAFMAEMFVGVLVGGIGILLFSLGVLRTKIAPTWVAWLGFAVAVLGGWVTPLGPVAEVFELMELIGLAGLFVWMGAMGVAVWRAPERGNRPGLDGAPV